MHSFPLGLRGVDVSFGIDGDAVHMMELSGIPALPAEVSDDLQGFAIEYPDMIVGAVGNVNESLGRICG